MSMATDKSSSWEMSQVEAGFMGFVLGIIFMALATEWHTERLEQKAHECAVTSIGTDSAIEDCYRKFNVPFPGY